VAVFSVRFLKLYQVLMSNLKLDTLDVFFMQRLLDYVDRWPTLEKNILPLHTKQLQFNCPFSKTQSFSTFVNISSFRYCMIIFHSFSNPSVIF
jgi:hypothetical protein